MYITLPFICLCYKKIGDVPANGVFITDGITTEDFLQPIA